MTQSPARRVTRTWTFLILLTGLSMLAGHASITGLVTDGIVLIAAVAKGRWVLLDFLKLRAVPAGWSALLSSWLMLIAAVAWMAAALPALHG